MLKTRVGEHILNPIDYPYPIDGKGLYPASAIAHLIETGHKVNVNHSFKVVYKNKRGRMLRFTEALAIRRLKLPLCVQKQFIFSPRLPWA